MLAGLQPGSLDVRNLLAMAPGSPTLEDAAMFARRSERKFFVDPARAEAFVDRIGDHLAVHRFAGTEASSRPRAIHTITTLYFDTPGREVAAACTRGRHSLKLRARSYYDHTPGELAGRSSATLRRDQTVWMEIKGRDRGVVRKLRFPVPVGEVPAFLAGAELSSRAVDLHRRHLGEGPAALRHELRMLRAGLRGPLRPDCLVQYRRRAWQGGGLRITLDSDVSYHRPADALFERFTTLRDAAAQPPVGRLRRNLVELKLRSAIPEWFAAIAREVGLRPALLGEHGFAPPGRQFSKFLAASTAVRTAGA